jgi:hypothetical protein
MAKHRKLCIFGHVKVPAIESRSSKASAPMDTHQFLSGGRQHNLPDAEVGGAGDTWMR